MIALVSCALAAYEAFATLSKRKTVTDYSHAWPWALLVWGWWLWLGLHFAEEARA